MNRLCALIFLGLMIGTGHAQPAGDYFIRSQTKTGEFNGYQQILTRKKDGYYSATYCRRQFWVRKLTVLWTETEASAGHKLYVERASIGKRTLICKDPNLQVNLNDIGLSEEEITFLRTQNTSHAMKPSRMKIISKAFHGK